MGIAVLSSSTMVLFFAVITLAHLFCFPLQVIKMVVSFFSLAVEGVCVCKCLQEKCYN